MIRAAYFQMAGAGKPFNQNALFNGVEVKQAKLKKSCWVELDNASLRFALADGVFNSPAPQKASKFWMQQFALDGQATAAFLKQHFNRFCESMQPEHYGSSTTFAAVTLTENGQVILCNVGDSRIYHIDVDGKWTQISHDHTLLAALIEEGKASAEIEYAGIYYSLEECLIADFEEAHFKVFTHQCRLNDGESLILCSDGLSDGLTHTQLEHIWQSHDGILAKLEALRLAVKKVPYHDDCSVICIQAV